MTTLVAMVVLGALRPAVEVALPLVGQPLPLPFLVAVAIPSLVVVPLYAAFPWVEATLPRSAAVRAATVTLTLTGTAIALLVLSGFHDHGTDLPLKVAFLLVTSGPVAVVGMGELAWIVPMLLGFCSLLVGHGYAAAQLSSHVPWPLIVVGIAASAVLYWRFGAREIRTSG
ncbi:hypothetical protein [Marmoricola sp. RAF53]|uniref:hypothetical protein n=1 Tax=Marmoricola sp. RAF53 TaxID=3233059 RepID=UPI003F99C231